MDKRIQHFTKSIVLLLVFMGFNTFGQCNDSIVLVHTDTCKSVQMPLNTFTEFYKAKKNLTLLSEEIPNIKGKIDSLHKINEKTHANYQEEIDSTNAQNTILVTSLEDCSETLAEVDLDNLYLNYKLNFYIKKPKRMFILGSGAGILSTIGLIKLLSN